jgi:hypothetical protein
MTEQVFADVIVVQNELYEAAGNTRRIEEVPFGAANVANPLK